jgi:hypothetical protein
LCITRPAITKPAISIAITIATSLETTQGKKKSTQVLQTPIKPKKTTTRNTNKAQETTTTNTNGAEENMTMNNGKDETESTIDL